MCHQSAGLSPDGVHAHILGVVSGPVGVSQSRTPRDFSRKGLMWELVEGVIVMRNVVSINNGTVNLDVIEFNPLTRSLIVQAYILK